MLKLLIILTFITIQLSAQTDWIRWEKRNGNYQILSAENNSTEVSKKTSILSLMKDGYSFFISDLDGDNCPFYPTCSSFFVQSVKETNIIKGTLMFADRFTRDSNIFKSRTHYPSHISGKLFDPIDNYLLTDSTIIFYSREKLVK